MSFTSKIIFKHFNSVSNPSSIHGIYPYRGKISALDAASIIEQLPNRGTLLDPFCGSGTIVYEAQKHGLKALGVDNNPLAIRIAKAKIYKNSSLSLKLLDSIISKARLDKENNMIDEMPKNPRQSFHIETSKEIMSVKKYYENMDDYIKGIFLGTIALAARACNGYIWTSSTVGKNKEIKDYCNFYEKIIIKARKHFKYLPQETVEDACIIQGDSRKLSDIIPEKSIDFVFTSPPYFDSLDYTAYYGKIIYEIFEKDRISIKKQLIQHANSYKEDMCIVLEELDKVTTDDAIIIFVVGDKKVGKEIINGGEFFNNIKKASYIHERSYSGSASAIFDAINKTDRKEQIVVWNKIRGEVEIYD